MPPTRDLARNPGICPDWELNQQPFGLQAAAQSTEPHGPGPCMPFKQTLLRNWQFLPLPQSPLVLQLEVMSLYFPGAGTLGCAVWPGAGISCSQGVPPDFYPPHVNVGLPFCWSPWLLTHCHHPASSPPRLPVSAPPTHLDKYFFFKSLVVELP